MKNCLCEDCKKEAAEYRMTFKGIVINVCEECSEKEKYYKFDSIPLDELQMDEDEREGWDTLVEYYNK